MNAVLNLLASEAWRHLTFTLLHTLWQASLVAVALYAALRWMPAGRPNRRYAAALAALGLVLLAALTTWSIYRIDRPFVPHEMSAVVYAPVPAEALPAVHTSYHAPELAQSLHWTTGLAALWLAGAGVGLLRAGRLLLRAGRVRRNAESWDEPAVHEALARLKAALRVGRRVRVAVSARVDVPGVIGLLRPMVIFPAAIAAGMAPAHLDAILAHELAHIRRYDYWVNLVQLLVEALLFFNPAVWWISRRIRIEREACCDALAASATGVPVAYASALAALAERLATGIQPALAATGGEDEHVLLDRVKRLLVPGYRPRLGLSWYTLTALLLSAMVVLAGLSQGVFSAVALAAKALTSAERVEQIQAIQKIQGSPDSDTPAVKVAISGIVRTEDGAPLPEDFGENFRIVSSRRCGAVSTLTFHSDGRFEDLIEPGTVYIVADADGYAFTLVGPLTANAGEDFDGLELVLQRGAPASLRVKGPDGRPLPGAKLSGRYQVNFGGVGEVSLETDTNGLATVEHYAGVPMSFDVAAEGYARDNLEKIVLDPRQPFECVLKATRPTTGVATAEESGRPLADLVLMLYAEQGGRGIYIHGPKAESLAVTDAQGRFTIGTLREDMSYTLLAQGADGRKGIVTNVAAGRSLNIHVPPPFRIRGRITGDLSLLEKDDEGPFVACEQAVTALQYGPYTLPGKARVELRGQEGFFETEPLLPGEVTLAAGPRQMRLKVPGPSAELVIDLASGQKTSPGMRTLVLQFEAEAGAPVPQGLVDLDIAQPGFQVLKKDNVALLNGEVRVDVPAPSTVEYRTRNLVGYWAEEKTGIAVPEGSEPFVLTVPVRPAGAIHGRVLEPDGSNAGTGISVSLVRIKVPKALRDKSYFQYSVVRDGSFMLPSIPFGVTCSVLAWDEQRAVESEDFIVDARNPIHEVTLQFGKGETIRGRVVDETGAPMAGFSVGLSYGRPHTDSYGNSDAARSGPDGRFAIEGVNPDVPGRYKLSLESRIDYVPVEFPVEPGEKEYVLTVKKGLSLEGKVVDDKTGAPIAGAVITAIECKWFGRFAYYPSEAGTDQDGNFRFSNLVPGKYYFWVNGVLPLMDEPVIAGTSEPLVLRMGEE